MKLAFPALVLAVLLRTCEQQLQVSLFSKDVFGGLVFAIKGGCALGGGLVCRDLMRGSAARLCRARLCDFSKKKLNMNMHDWKVWPRPDLEKQISQCTNSMACSVLVWGAHQSGKSTFVKSFVQGEASGGRPVLFTEAKPHDTLESLFRRLFRWSNDYWFRGMVLRVVRRGNLTDLDAIDLQGLEQKHGRPMLVIDDVNFLSEDVLDQLLTFSKKFVEHRVALFVLVLSGGTKGSHIRRGARRARLQQLYVGDMSRADTVGFLTEQGRTEEEAHAIFDQVGGRFEYLQSAATPEFQWEDFRNSIFVRIEGEVVDVSSRMTRPWSAAQTCSILSSFLQAPGQLDPQQFSSMSDGTAEAVHVMLARNLLQQRVDNGKLELHSTAERSFLNDQMARIARDGRGA